MYFYPGLKPMLSLFLPAMFYVSERRRQASLSKAIPVIFLCWAYHYCNDKVCFYTLAVCVYVCVYLHVFFFSLLKTQ